MSRPGEPWRPEDGTEDERRWAELYERTTGIAPDRVIRSGRLRRLLARLAVLALAGALVVGCSSKEDRGKGDSPVDRGGTNNEPAHIITFPDTFFNMARKCEHGVGFYSNTRTGGVPVIVKDDPNCPQR